VRIGLNGDPVAQRQPRQRHRQVAIDVPPRPPSRDW
jgi:hypothetical protein